jgi:hypothetical protein
MQMQTTRWHRCHATVSMCTRVRYSGTTTTLWLRAATVSMEVVLRLKIDVMHADKFFLILIRFVKKYVQHLYL